MSDTGVGMPTERDPRKAMELALRQLTAEELSSMIGGLLESLWAQGFNLIHRSEQHWERLGRIGQAHSKDVDKDGGTWGDCRECGHSWPCPTYVWATTKRDPVLACWDPVDDEAPEGEESA